MADHAQMVATFPLEAQDEVWAGNIVAVSGIPDVAIGDTLCDPEDPRPLPPITPMSTWCEVMTYSCPTRVSNVSR